MSELVGEFSIDRPVFVMGTGRCGLTPLMHLIAYHADFAWPSQYNGRFPERYSVSFLSRLVDFPMFKGRLKFLRYLPRHEECYQLWTSLFHGFGRPFRDLVADDVSPHVRRRFQHALSEIVRWQGKKRFIAEYSGWSRIEFLRTIFPDARFIHIVRDGRAVANSLTHVKWWNGWEGIHRWRLGLPGGEDLAKLEKYSFSFLALAAIYWKMLIRNIIEKTSKLPAGDFLQVRYEDLVKDPRAKALECIDFAGLDGQDARLLKHLETVKVVDANRACFRIPSWRDNMSLAHVEMLNDLLGEELEQFGYLESAGAGVCAAGSRSGGGFP